MSTIYQDPIFVTASKQIRILYCSVYVDTNYFQLKTNSIESSHIYASSRDFKSCAFGKKHTVRDTKTDQDALDPLQVWAC